MQFHFFISITQLTDIFDQFADNLELTLDEVANYNPFLIVVLSDFNGKSENWYKHDKTSYEGAKMDTLTTQFQLQQIIKDPTDFLAESSSCIDSLFDELFLWMVDRRKAFSLISSRDHCQRSSPSRISDTISKSQHKRYGFFI